MMYNRFIETRKSKMARYLTFVYQGARGTVTANGFVSYNGLACQHTALVGGLRDMVNATMYRLGAK